MIKLIFPLLLIGVSSVIAQIVLLRELLVLFSGNELSIGIILANWLFWTTQGSWAGGKISKNVKSSVCALAFLEITLAFLLVLTIYAIRCIKIIYPALTGEILGIIPIWLYSFIFLAGICFVNGILFVSGCRILEDEKEIVKENIVGRVYILESIGSSIGGILCSILFIKYFSTLQIMFFLVVLNLFSAGILWKKIRWFAYLGLVIIILSACLGALKVLEIKSRQWQWGKEELLVSKDSIYGNVSIVKRGSVYSFYENGLLAFSFPDELTNEETCHLALLQHPRPKKVLLLGGGAGGVIDEILKYPSIKYVDYVELDPMIVTLVKRILQYEAFKDKKARIHNVDGRRFLNTMPALYDVIIVNLPDPSTAQLNRFYTEEFFASVSKHLNDNGVLEIGVTSSENYISKELGDILRCMYYTLKEVFPSVKVIPGDYCRFIAAKEEGFVTDDYKVLENRIHVETKYVRDYYLKDKLSEGRLKYIYDILLSGPAQSIINTDFHPVCYYYNITFWSTYFNDVFKRIFHAASKIKLWHFYFLPVIAFVIRKVKKENAALLAIMTSGFSEISFQVVTMLSFQVLYGYVYYKLGIIITSFMMGLALGSYCINKILENTNPVRKPELSNGIKSDNKLFIYTQVAITIYPLILPVIFYLLKGNEKYSYFGENIILPYLPIIAGFIGGFQFPLGNKIYMQNRENISGTAGITYGIDLFGACFGILLISAFILPILGIIQTCIITAIVNLMSLIIVFKAKK
jgi:spermidine synthase